MAAGRNKQQFRVKLAALVVDGASYVRGAVVQVPPAEASVLLKQGALEKVGK